MTISGLKVTLHLHNFPYLHIIPDLKVKVPCSDLLFPLFAFQRFVAELASEQIHPQDAAQDEKQ